MSCGLTIKPPITSTWRGKRIVCLCSWFVDVFFFVCVCASPLATERPYTFSLLPSIYYQHNFLTLPSPPATGIWQFSHQFCFAIRKQKTFEDTNTTISFFRSFLLFTLGLQHVCFCFRICCVWGTYLYRLLDREVLGRGTKESKKQVSK